MIFNIAVFFRGVSTGPWLLEVWVVSNHNILKIVNINTLAFIRLFILKVSTTLMQMIIRFCAYVLQQQVYSVLLFLYMVFPTEKQ